MIRSSMRSSSGSFLFISLLMLLILKTIKIFKNFKSIINPSWLCGQHMLPHNHDGLIIILKFLNILISATSTRK